MSWVLPSGLPFFKGFVSSQNFSVLERKHFLEPFCPLGKEILGRVNNFGREIPRKWGERFCPAIVSNCRLWGSHSSWGKWTSLFPEGVWRGYGRVLYMPPLDPGAPFEMQTPIQARTGYLYSGSGSLQGLGYRCGYSLTCGCRVLARLRVPPGRVNLCDGAPCTLTQHNCLRMSIMKAGPCVLVWTEEPRLLLFLSSFWLCCQRALLTTPLNLSMPFLSPGTHYLQSIVAWKQDNKTCPLDIQIGNAEDHGWVLGALMCGKCLSLKHKLCRLVQL